MKPLSFESRIFTVAMLTATAILSACQFGDKNIHFIEEVQLASGDVIEVERFIKAAPLGEVGGPGGWSSDYESFEIIDKNIATPKWVSTAGLSPVLFDKDSSSKEWVLVASFYTCDAWYSLGRPKLPYAEFRVRDGQWRQVELSTQWLGHATNVFTGISSNGEPERLTLADKRKRDSPMVAPKYRSIVSKWSTGC